MLNLKNGTAIAIILSIAFVLIAVAGRDLLPSTPGAAENSVATATTGQVGQQQVTSIGGSTDFDRSYGLASSSNDPAQPYAETDDDDDYRADRDRYEHDDDDDHDEHEDGHDD